MAPLSIDLPSVAGSWHIILQEKTGCWNYFDVGTGAHKECTIRNWIYQTGSRTYVIFYEVSKVVKYIKISQKHQERKSPGE